VVKEKSGVFDKYRQSVCLSFAPIAWKTDKFSNNFSSIWLYTLTTASLAWQYKNVLEGSHATQNFDLNIHGYRAESVNLAVFSEPTHREEYIKKHVGDKKVERYVATDGMTTKKNHQERCP